MKEKASARTPGKPIAKENLTYFARTELRDRLVKAIVLDRALKVGLYMEYAIDLGMNLDLDLNACLLSHLIA